MRRILYVSIQSSPHAARWIDCIADAGFDLHMFGHDQHPPHKLLRNVTLHWPVRPITPASQLAMSILPVSLIMRARRFINHARQDPRDASKILIRKLLPRQTLVPGTAPTSEPQLAESKLSPAAPPVRMAYFTPQAPCAEGERVPFGNSGADCDALNGPKVLAEVIAKVKPDLIHSMEFQHCAYLVLAARDILGADGFPPWLATNWGSDISLFGRDPEHAPIIRRVLTAVTLYSCECHRDVALGRDFGYGGPDLPVLPNSGGMDLEALQPVLSGIPPSGRKMIMVKGYDHFAGRAMISLDIIERFADRLKDYEIVLFSVGARPRARALQLKASGKLNIRVIDYAEHAEILWHFARSRIYLGVSIADAISTSVLEAMATGCFPIQTNTSCCEEWFESGVGGFAVPHDDVDEIARRFSQALEDDALVDRAAGINRAVIEKRLKKEVIKPQVRSFYETAFEHIGR